MALPSDALVKYRVQYDRQFLEQAEVLARTLRPDIWETYVFTGVASGLTGGHSRETEQFGTGQLTVGQRKMRVVGCFLGVSWATSDANTESLIATAVGLFV